MKSSNSGVEATTPASGSADIIAHRPDGTDSSSTVTALQDIELPRPPDKFTLKFHLLFNDRSMVDRMVDLWLALTLGKGT
jgi:hypothetical protein